MGTIAQEITRINGAKAAIKAAIERYGETIPAATLIDGYAPYIDNISGGSWLPSAQTILETFSRKVSEHRGPATIEKIYGRTIIWNQKIDAENASTYSAQNGSGSISGTEYTYTGDNSTNKHSILVNLGVVPANHILLVIALIKFENYLPTDGGWNGVSFSGVALTNIEKQTVPTLGQYVATWNMIKTASSATGYARIGYSDTTFNASVKNLMFFDLTQIFQEESKPAASQEFRDAYSLPYIYYPYDPGTLKPLAPEALESRGINQWDEVWELGAISSSTGNNVASSSDIRSANYIPLIAGTTYYFKASIGVTFRFYDANKTFLAQYNRTINPGSSFTTPEGAAFVRFWGAASSYNHDICINISNPAINGQYFPYRGCRAGINLQNFPYGMNGIGTVYDEKTPKKDIRRLGMVDLGDLNYTLDTSKTYKAFFVTNDQILDLKRPASTTVIAVAKCSAYTVGTQSDWGQIDKRLAITSYGGVIITDDSYSDPTAFKAAMAGQKLVYELADYIETPTDDDMTYIVDEGGTEEVTPITAPFSADIRYAKQI